MGTRKIQEQFEKEVKNLVGAAYSITEYKEYLEKENLFREDQ